MKLGMSLGAAAKQAGFNPTAAKTIHERPVVIKELDWWPRLAGQQDPVRQAQLSFFNGQLFRIAITYDRYKVEGLTPDDLIAGISATYGAATKPGDKIAYHSNFSDVAPVIARWEDEEYSLNLIRSGDQYSFVIVLLSKELDRLAQDAIVEADRLDRLEAPQRELDRQQKQAVADQVLLEKARSVNKPNFRP